MSVFVGIEIELDDETSAVITPKLLGNGTRGKRRDVGELVKLLEGVNGGGKRGIVRAMISPTAASVTIGCDESDAVDATDTVTIGPITLSVEASPSGELEFAAGATDITFAANLVVAILAHSVLKKLFHAVSDGVDTVTVTALVAGLIGNEIAITKVGNGFTLGAAALAGGTSGTHYEYDFGHTRA